MPFEPDWTTLRSDQKWNILGKQKRFLLWALYTSIGSLMLGFDFSVASTSFALPSFQKEFGELFPTSPSGYIVPARLASGMIGASAGGEFVGVMLAAYLMDVLGRKHVMSLGSVVTAIGVAMQMPAHGWRLFLSGRFVNAIGFGAVFVQSPVWIGENVRPELRGFFLCVTNGSIVLGQFLLSCVAKGSSYINGNWQWQTLVVLQFVPILIMLLGYPFFPESPYFYMTRAKPELARKSLLRIHGSKDQGLIESEMRRIETAARLSKEMAAAVAQHGPGWIQCLKGTNLKRTMIACLPPAGQQLIGAAFVLGYITYFLSLVGVKEFFTVSLILYVVMLLSNLSAFFFIEKAGRRALLFPGVVVLTVVLFIMGCMGLTKAPAAIWVVVVCIFIWAIAYQLTIGAVGFALASEVGSLPLRPYTQAYLATSQDAFGFVVAYTTPYMISPDAGDLGAKVGFVFAGLGLLASISFYFLIPETKGLSLDELDYLFTNKISCRRFQSAVREYRETTAAVDMTPDMKIDMRIKGYDA